MTDKVIDFVEAWVKRHDANEAEEMRHEDPDLFFAYEFAIDCVTDIVVALHEMDYNIGIDAKSITEIMLIEESLRSLVMRCAEKEYPFQTLCENLFVDENGNELDHNELMRTFIEDLKG